MAPGNLTPFGTIRLVFVIDKHMSGLSAVVRYLELVTLFLQQGLIDGHRLQLIDAGLHLGQPPEHVLLQLLVGAERVGAGPALPQSVIQQLLQLRPLALQLLRNREGSQETSRAPAAPTTGSPGSRGAQRSREGSYDLGPRRLARQWDSPAPGTWGGGGCRHDEPYDD